VNSEQTYISIKNEAIQKGIIGEIITRFEKVGLKLVAIKMIVPTAEILGKQYPDADFWYSQVGEKTKLSRQKRGITDDRDSIEIGKWVRGMILEDLVGKPQVAMVWEGAHAVEIAKKLIGITNPLDSDVGTIRADYTVESYDVADFYQHPVRTLVHRSGSVEEAKDEIALWFNKEEIQEYPLVLEEILYKNNWGKIIQER
jgi:nucleoside-diphosphate kinase